MTEEDVDATERIAELESTVVDLQATVRGLTEELVDANERIRLLEAELGVDGTPSGGSRRSATEDDESAGPDVDAGADETPAGSDAEASAVGDATEGGDEAPKSPGDEHTDQEDPEALDDIIVA